MNYRIIYITIITFLVFSSCRDEPEDTIKCFSSSSRDEINFISTLDVSSPTIDVEAGETSTITAAWDKDAYWVLEIRGDSSNMSEKYDGCGNSLAITWDGINKTHPQYLNENCTVTLSFPENSGSNSSTDNIRISNTIDYSNGGTDGVLINDINRQLSGQTFSKAGQYSSSESWVSFDSVYGGKYLQMNFQRSSSNTTTQPLLGRLTFEARNKLPLFNNFYDVTELDPSQLYFNLYVHGNGSNNVKLRIVIFESNNDDTSPEEIYQISREESIPVNSNEWKLITKRMSDFNFRRLGGVRPFNDIPNLNQITRIDLEMISVNRGFTDVYDYSRRSIAVDHIIFTYGKPLNINP